MKLFHYEIHLISKHDNSYNKIKGVVMTKNIMGAMGAMNKLNEYYADNDDTIVVANLTEEDNTPCELSCEEI